jgi:phage shock protein B
MFGLGTAEYFIAAFSIFVVIGLPILCVTFLIAMLFRRKGNKERDRTQWNEETRIMQEMHDNLSKMEARIEALETILMERFGKDNR